MHSSHAAAVILDLYLKSLLILAVPIGVCLCWRRASAAMRHWLWFIAVASLACLPLSSFLVPAWQKPLWSVSTDLNSGNQLTVAIAFTPGAATDISPPATPAAPMNGAEANASRNNRRIATRFDASWLMAARAFWVVGVLLGTAFVGLGWFQLRSLRRGAHAPVHPNWLALLEQLRREFRIRRPVTLLQTPKEVMPMTWGGWRPVVLLPEAADGWPLDRQRVVLLHELAHIRRWDCWTQWIARVICAVYWFNPLVWLAARQMCIERERACDDLVLNGGCKASDYAGHLVDIARLFRRLPYATAIAMARPSGLAQRITAIVDGERKRTRLATLNGAVIGLAGFVFATLIGVCATTTKEELKPWSIERSPARDALKRFVAEKEKQAYAAAKAEGKEILPEYKAMFAAAARGDWLNISNVWEDLRSRAPQYEGSEPRDGRLHGTAWQTMLEIWGAFGNIAAGEEKYMIGLGRDAIQTISPGSIYFGGTDPGRCVITALQQSHVRADPFFTITQNALADASYLEYVRRMYGGRIQALTDADSQKCYDEYLKDATQRFKDKTLRPGENVKFVDGKAQVTGQIAVMSVNGLLTKVLFEKNPDREFYVEESFPLTWMYPHLSPAGPILKLNREPLKELSDEILQRDREYWARTLTPMIGDWLNENTSVRELAEFATQAYNKPPALDGHNHSDGANKWASKLRCSIAGVYAWRMQQAITTKNATERERMNRAADFAFRQAYAVCPYSPEAIFRYVNLLMSYSRITDALLIVNASARLQPDDGQLQNLIRELKRMEASQKASGGKSEP